MKGNLVLAQDESVGSIQQCTHGTIHLHCGSISIRLHPDSFFTFARMVEEASSQLMNRSLAKLLDESEES